MALSVKTKIVIKRRNILNNLEIIRTRNKLMAEIMWIISIIYIEFSALSGVDKKSLIIIAPILVGFIVMVILSLYQSYIDIMLTAIFIISSLVYGYFSAGGKMYGTFNDLIGLAIVITSFILIAILFCIQIKATERLRKAVEVKKNEIEDSKEIVEKVLA